jgi:branched-chain amino acid transport system substrate-binding protein
MKKYQGILLMLGLIIATSCSKDQPDAVQTVKINGLYSITGNWSSLGKASQSAMELALKDVNTYLDKRGSSFRLAGSYSDTKLEPAVALSEMRKAFGEGTRIFIGPQSSAELAAIKDFSNSNNILVISQGSTASSLAIANDEIFRYCPGDAVEGAAISNTIFAANKRTVITLARNDAGNIGLQNAVGNRIKALGGQVDAISPYATDLTDYGTLLASLKSKIQQYSNAQGAEKVAVYIASFDECKDIFRQASSDPVFATVNWYGGDGVVQSEALLSDTEARNFCVKTGFFAPNFGLPVQPHPDLQTISDAIKTASGVEPDAYALSVYDAVWVIAMSINNYPDALTDFNLLKTSFTTESNKYFGITGPTLLNEYGDRKMSSFDYWGIINENGVYHWRVVGKSI